MSRIKKYNLENQIHFVTGNVYKRVKLFEQYPVCAEVLLKSLEFYRNKLGFRVLAYVVMPEHYHFLIYPDSQRSISRIMMVVKGHTAKEVVGFLKKEDPEFLANFRIPPDKIKRLRDSTYQIFQKDSYDLHIHSEQKLIEKINYIHYNPVHIGLVQEPSEYLLSSARFYEEKKDNSIIKVDNLFELPVYPVAEATGIPRAGGDITRVGSPLVHHECDSPRVASARGDV